MSLWFFVMVIFFRCLYRYSVPSHIFITTKSLLHIMIIIVIIVIITKIFKVVVVVVVVVVVDVAAVVGCETHDRTSAGKSRISLWKKAIQDHRVPEILGSKDVPMATQRSKTDCFPMAVPSSAEIRTAEALFTFNLQKVGYRVGPAQMRRWRFLFLFIQGTVW